MNFLGKILFQIGSGLYGIFGAIHDALISPDQPATLTTEELDQSDVIGPTVPVQVGSFRNTVQYYIGGVFVVTALVTFFLVKMVPSLNKLASGKKRATRRRTTRRKSPVRRTRRTYKRRK
jgi:hypothetical protein